MSITIAGLGLFLGLIGLFLKKKLNFESLFVLTLFSELYLEIGFAIQIGGYINYRTIMEFLLFFFVILKMKGIPMKLIRQASILFACLLTSVVLLYLFPSNQLVAVVDTSWDDILLGASRKNPTVNGFVIQMLIQFFIYLCVFIYIISNYKEKDYLRLLKISNSLINLMLILGLIEFVVVSILHMGPSWGNMKEAIFGFSESTITAGRARGNLYELCLLTKEASHYALLLFLTFLIKMGYNLSTKKRVFDFLILLNLFLMAVAMSFTALLCALGLCIILLTYRWKILKPSTMKAEKTVLIVMVGVLLSSLSAFVAGLSGEGFFSRRILSLIEEINIVTTDSWMTERDALEWSNRVRLLGVFQTMKAFLYRPVLGYGVGAVTAHAATPMFLAGAGVVGVYLWSKFNFYQRRMLQMFYTNRNGLGVSVMIFFFVFMFGGFLRNFYELSVIMLAISFCIIFSKRRIL